MPAKSVLSLAATIFLCLPSLVGGVVLLANLLLQHRLEEWGQTVAAAVPLGVFVGGSLVAIATILGVLLAVSPVISKEVKSAHLIIVGLGAIATVSLLFRFAA